MQLYLAIVPKPQKEMTLYRMPDSAFSSSSITKRPSIMTEPTNSDEIVTKLNQLEEDVGTHFHNNRLVFESRYIPPKDWKVLEERMVTLWRENLPEITFDAEGLIFYAIKSKDGSFYTTTGEVRLEPPEIMFEWDRNILISKNVISFFKNYVKSAKKPYFLSIFCDNTMMYAFQESFRSNYHLSFFYSQPEGKYLFASRMIPLIKTANKKKVRSIAKKILNTIQTKKLIHDATLEEVKVKTRNIHPVEGKDELEDALTLMVHPSEKEFPGFHLINEIFGIDANFSYKSSPLDIDTPSRRKELFIFNLEHMSPILGGSFQSVKEMVDMENLGTVQSGRLMTYGDTDLDSLKTYHKVRKNMRHSRNVIFRETPTLSSAPANLNQVLDLIKSGSLNKIRLRYSFYSRVDHESAMYKTFRQLLPEQYKNKNLIYLMKLRNIGINRGCGEVSVEVRDPSKSADDLTYILNHPPFPGVIYITGKKGGGKIVAYPFEGEIKYGNIHGELDDQSMKLFPFIESKNNER